MEYSKTDAALAVATAALVMAGSALVLQAAALHQPTGALEIDTSVSVPVRVVPIDLDAPLLKLGGGRPRSSWAPPRPPAPAPGGAALAGKGVSLADAGAPPADAGAPPTEAEAESLSTGTAQPGDDAGAASAPAGPGSPEGAAEGTETDPLRARAADVYRSRLVAWFSGRFRVSGSGLPQSTLTKLRAQATVQVDGSRRVAGYTLIPSGNAVFDGAARASLESAKGQELPPPPENYPDLVQTSISITFVCKEGRCD